MSRQIGLYVDVSNLYAQIKQVYRSRLLDYEKYYKFVSALGNIQVALAYGCQKGIEAEGFRTRLQSIGFQTKYKRPRIHRNNVIMRAQWNVTLTLDVVNKVEHINCLVLGSSDKRLIPLIHWCKENGIMVIVLACVISKPIQKAADRTIEIPESLLVCRSN